MLYYTILYHVNHCSWNHNIAQTRCEPRCGTSSPIITTISTTISSTNSSTIITISNITSI